MKELLDAFLLDGHAKWARIDEPEGFGGAQDYDGQHSCGGFELNKKQG